MRNKRYVSGAAEMQNVSTSDAAESKNLSTSVVAAAAPLQRGAMS